MQSPGTIWDVNAAQTTMEVELRKRIADQEAYYRTKISELERVVTEGQAVHANAIFESLQLPMLSSSGAVRRTMGVAPEVDDPETQISPIMQALRDLPPESNSIVIMAIIPNGYPAETIDREKLKVIETRLGKAAEGQARATRAGFAVAVGRILPQQGGVVIECRNVGSINWLMFAVEELEMGLSCMPASEAGLRPAFMGWVCEPNATFQEVIMAFHAQGVPTHECILLKDYGPDIITRKPGEKLFSRGRRFLFLGNAELKELALRKPLRVQYKMCSTQATVRYLLGILDVRRNGGNQDGKQMKQKRWNEIIILMFKVHNNKKSREKMKKRLWRSIGPTERKCDLLHTWRSSSRTHTRSRKSTQSREPGGCGAAEINNGNINVKCEMNCKLQIGNFGVEAREGPTFEKRSCEGERKKNKGEGNELKNNEKVYQFRAALNFSEIAKRIFTGGSALGMKQRRSCGCNTHLLTCRPTVNLESIDGSPRHTGKKWQMNNAELRESQGNQKWKNRRKINTDSKATKAAWINAFITCGREEYPIENG